MTTIPVKDLNIIEQFGPHLAHTKATNLDTGLEPDKIVQTHCCFCGQQCGIQLKVKNNEVIGFEPWYDFPFNQGKLCPKGVKRYLQGSHPDRLLHAYRRDESAPGGFSPIAYQEAIKRVAAEIERIQLQYGPHAFGLLSGASLTTEKTYLVGKFAHMGLKTSNIDYNGRLCMVSAAAGNKKAFGIDRAANPWSDILKTGVVWISGANVAERLGLADGDWATTESRRGSCTLRVLVLKTIRPDTVFIPYHWAGRKSANQLTISAQDPISKIPEFKVCAVRVKKADAPPAYANELESQQ